MKTNATHRNYSIFLRSFVSLNLLLLSTISGFSQFICGNAWYPANSWIYIDSNKKLSDIKIFSLNGALVYSSALNVEDIKHAINVETLLNGVYLAKIICLNGEVITDKFIKN